MILVFFNAEFQASFFTLSFHPYQEAHQFLFTFAIGMVPSAYMKLLIFSPAILIPACDASSLAFHIKYSAQKLNKQGDNIQSCIPYPVWNHVSCCMSSSNCCFLTHIQVSQETGRVVWYSYLFKNFPVCCEPHKDFHLVDEAEVNVFLELPCFLHDPMECWQFDLWFLCLFQIQLVHLEVLSSHIVEALPEGF